MSNRKLLRRLKPTRPSPAMVVAVIALIVAMAGSATAATVVIRSSSQIRANAVNSGDIKDGVVSNKDLRKGTVKLDNLEAGARNAVSAAQTKAFETFRKVGPVDQPKGDAKRVLTVNAVEPGVYAVFAKTTITAEPPPSGFLAPAGRSNSGHCVLDAGGEKDDARMIIGGPGFNSPGTLHLQLTKTFGSSGQITLDCDSAETAWGASDSTVIAIKVGAAPKQSVDG